MRALLTRLIPRTILGMVSVISLLMTAVALIICVSIYSVTHEALEAQLNQRIATEADILKGIYQTGGTPAVATEIQRRERYSRVTGMGYMLVGRGGDRVAGILQAKLPEMGWHEFLYDDEGNGKFGVSQSLTQGLSPDLTLVVAADRTPVDRMDEALFRLFGAVFGAMLIIGAGGALGLGFAIRRRLANIDTTAQAIIDGDLARRMARDGTSSEFDRLSETLNRMLDRNAELVANIQQVSSDIAHDLRTPLTRLQQVLDEAAGSDDIEVCRTAVATASERTHEIVDLFNALLRISEIETLKVRAYFGRIDLSEIIEKVADAFRPDLEASHYRLETRLEDDCFISGDRHLMSQLLVNLIENVMRHTPQGTAMAISLHKEDDMIHLVVSDNGPGIEATDRDLVLRRFARLERSRSAPGFGLGLSLVSAIAYAHQSRPELTDNQPGLRIRFVFPAM